MLLRLLLLFSLVPLVELALFIWIGRHVPWQVTVLLIFGPSVVGAVLTRWAGVRCLREARRQLAEGRLPTEPLLEGIVILLAGALLITPGLLTDTAGLLLLVPPVRHWVRYRVALWLCDRFLGPEGETKIIDVRVEDADEPS